VVAVQASQVYLADIGTKEYATQAANMAKRKNTWIFNMSNKQITVTVLVTTSIFALQGCMHYSKTDWSRESVRETEDAHIYEVQLAAKTYSAPGYPDVLLIGMCHTGYPSYYDKVNKKLKDANIVIGEGVWMVYSPGSSKEVKRKEFEDGLRQIAGRLSRWEDIELPETKIALSVLVSELELGPYNTLEFKQLLVDPWGNDVVFYPQDTQPPSGKTRPAMLVSYGDDGIFNENEVGSDDISIFIEADPWFTTFWGKRGNAEIWRDTLDAMELGDDAVSQWDYLKPSSNWIAGDWGQANYKEYWGTPNRWTESTKSDYADENDSNSVYWQSPYHFWALRSYAWERGAKKIADHVLARNDRAWDLISFHVDVNPENARTIAIPWGFSHMPDFERRLLNEFGYVVVEDDWITIWSHSNNYSSSRNAYVHHILKMMHKQAIPLLPKDVQKKLKGW